MRQADSTLAVLSPDCHHAVEERCGRGGGRVAAPGSGGCPQGIGGRCGSGGTATGGAGFTAGPAGPAAEGWVTGVGGPGRVQCSGPQDGVGSGSPSDHASGSAWGREMHGAGRGGAVTPVAPAG